MTEQIVAALEAFIADKRRLQAEHPLRYLFWEATLRCNLACRHCGSDCVRDNSSAAREIPAELIKRQLDDIARRHDPADITFAIIGGEPLVRDDIIDVGAHAASLGYFWGITTNGLLLEPDRVARLKAAGLKTISVSLDGLEADHDALRRRRGGWRQTVEGIGRLMDDRFWRAMDIICCVSRLNIDRLEPFIDILAGMGVPRVRFTPVFSRGRAGRDDGLLLDQDGYRRLLRMVADQRAGRSEIEVTLSEEGYWGPTWECRVRGEMHYCGSGTVIGSILHDGRVTGCPSVSRRFAFGSLHDESFLTLWDRDFGTFRAGREALFAPTCQGCAHWDLCEGGGFHLLDPEGPVPEACGMAKIGEREKI
ncbi:MAG: radical SAM protein [Rhodospirillales bacterium]|nr:radical SAM protein [Rhodospirillales bacterium]